MAGFLRVTLLVLVLFCLAAGGLLLFLNRPHTHDAPVFIASRWTRGNRIFPTQVAVFPDRVVRYTPRLFGHLEETIPIDQIASIKLDAGPLFADVIIETTGGSQPIICHGHWKKDAEGIRNAISRAQAARPKTH